MKASNRPPTRTEELTDAPWLRRISIPARSPEHAAENNSVASSFFCWAVRSRALDDAEPADTDLAADGRGDATGDDVGEDGGDHFALVAWKDGAPTSIEAGFALRDII